MMIYDHILTLFLLFFTYCIFGWVWECIYMSILEKTLLNRGFLNGPYIPIYGFGGLAVYFTLQVLNSPLRNINTLKIFFIGLFFATTLEYLTSVLLEKIFKARWWDYTDYKFNLNGRICLIASLFWGFISVMFVQVINPFLLSGFSGWNHDIKLIVVTFIATLMAADTVITIFSIINLQQKISSLYEEENEKWVKLVTKLGNIPTEYKSALLSYKEKAYNITNPFTRRLIKAFPKMRFLSTSRQLIFEKIKRNNRKSSVDLDD